MTPKPLSSLQTSAMAELGQKAHCLLQLYSIPLSAAAAHGKQQYWGLETSSPRHFHHLLFKCCPGARQEDNISTSHALE